MTECDALYPSTKHVFSLNRYLHSLLCKNQTVTEANRSLLVETLRSISEILIWGDQNDSSVFEWVVYKKYCIQNPLHAYFYFLISSYGTLLNVMKPNFHWHIYMNQRYMYFLWVNKKNLQQTICLNCKKYCNISICLPLIFKITCISILFIIAVLSFMMPTKTISLRFICNYFFPVFSWRRTCCHFSWDIYNRSLAALYVYSCYRHSTFYLKISGMRPHFVSPDVLADLSLLYCFKIVASIFLIMSIWNHLVKQISNH